jgi:hypothetical protein
MLYGVRRHIDFVGEREVVVDLAALQGSQIEVETLEVEDQIVRNVLETSPVL